MNQNFNNPDAHVRSRKLFPDLPRALVSMHVLLHEDRRILDDIDFSPRFVETDAPLARFVETVNALEVW